ISVSSSCVAAGMAAAPFGWNVCSLYYTLRFRNNHLAIILSPLGTNWGQNLLGFTIIHSDENRYEQEKPL
ncbi:hypothetical protein ABND12_20365, partial [Paenibacillus larvae]